MSIGLVIVARDEGENIGRALESARYLVDSWTLLDTGSTDGTPQIAQEVMSSLPGQVIEQEWRGFKEARTTALQAARGSADWLLMMDADMTVQAHGRLREWLDPDPDPGVANWRVLIADHNIRYRLPWLLRGDRDWRFEGVTHAYLVAQGRQRSLTGLTLHHHGVYKKEKFEHDLELLAPGVEVDDPRSVYYTAMALKALGRTKEAIEMYQRRARLGGWEEERWHALYMAGRLAGDVEALLAAHKERPHRHEPLKAAAELIKATQHDDYLFVEA